MSTTGSENNPQHGEDQGGGLPVAPVPLTRALGLFIDELCRFRAVLNAVDRDGDDREESEYFHIEVPITQLHRDDEIDVCVHASTAYIRIRRGRGETPDRAGSPKASTPRLVPMLS